MYIPQYLDVVGSKPKLSLYRSIDFEKSHEKVYTSYLSLSTLGEYNLTV